MKPNSAREDVLLFVHLCDAVWRTLFTNVFKHCFGKTILECSFEILSPSLPHHPGDITLLAVPWRWPLKSKLRKACETLAAPAVAALRALGMDHVATLQSCILCHLVARCRQMSPVSFGQFLFSACTMHGAGWSLFYLQQYQQWWFPSSSIISVAWTVLHGSLMLPQWCPEGGTELTQSWGIR